MLKIVQAGPDQDLDLVRKLFNEYASSLGISLDFQDFEEELATLPGIYAPPAGRLLLATHAGQPAGCVCLKGHDAATCELKRLYVRPKFRGLKIGWQLVNRLVAEARLAGYERMALDSHRSMQKAHALYEAVGFKRVSAPADFPESLKPEVVFMACDLSTNRGSTA